MLQYVEQNQFSNRRKLDVRNGSLGDIAACPTHVRFTPENRPSLPRLRNTETERLGGFEIDHQLVLGRLLDRQIARPFAPGRTRLQRRSPQFCWL